MLHFLPPAVKGVFSFSLYFVNTVILAPILIFFSLFKFIIPLKQVVIFLDNILIAIATLWIRINGFNTDLFCDTHWDVRGLEKLASKEWYLVLSNHQSWVDILVLQKVLNTKIPMLKFFLKKELIWVPFLGLAWWALDFPFMKRYSKATLKKHPHLKGKDLESTRRACRKFKHTPVSIMNFVEGTRYTPEKSHRSGSRFRHLLPPRAGGIAFVLGAMGEHLRSIIDVTIVYPGKTPTFWEFICGRSKRIIVDFSLLETGPHLMGDYFNDPGFKTDFCHWLNRLWQEKDNKINRLLNETRA